MENKIIDVEASELMSDLDRHEMQILNQMNIAVQTVFEIGKLLKTIRDGKEYSVRGIKSFQDYMNSDAGKPFKFGYTQANKYIQVYERYSPIQEQVKNVQLDVLYELRFFSDDELENISGLEDMNADEAKQLRRQLEEANEQISLLQSAVNNSEEVENLKEEIERLKSEPVTAAADNAKKEIAKIKKELKDKAKAEQDKAVREAVDKAKKDFEKEKSKAVKAASEELKNQVEGYKKKLEAQQENMSEAVRKTAEPEQKLKDKRTDNAMKFRLLFEQFQDSFDKLFDALDAVEDGKTQKSFAEKLRELGENIIAAAEEY